jgi:hypothetical protein
MKTLVMVCAIGAITCGCSKSSTPTSPTTTVTAPAPILFAGTLQPRTSRFYSYTLTSAGTVTALLASLEKNGAPAGNSLELGIGVPAGTGCAVTAVAYTSATLQPQLREDYSTGTYCVRISDVDGLPQAMSFTIRVIHP